MLPAKLINLYICLPETCGWGNVQDLFAFVCDPLVHFTYPITCFSAMFLHLVQSCLLPQLIFNSSAISSLNYLFYCLFQNSYCKRNASFHHCFEGRSIGSCCSFVNALCCFLILHQGNLSSKSEFSQSSRHVATVATLTFPAPVVLMWRFPMRQMCTVPSLKNAKSSCY